jgi:hypothetical protein
LELLETAAADADSRWAEVTFADDEWLATHLRVSPATIRSQRFRRRHGMPHWLTIDAVRIGAKPRYRLSDALAWLRSRTPVRSGDDA